MYYHDVLYPRVFRFIGRSIDRVRESLNKRFSFLIIGLITRHESSSSSSALSSQRVSNGIGHHSVRVS